MDRSNFADELYALLAEGADRARARERTEFDRLVSGYEKRLVLFGAGNLGTKVLHLLREDGIEPVAFADNGREKWGSDIHGVPVYSPTDAALEFGTTSAFLVTIWNHSHRMATTFEQLLHLGCRQVHGMWSFRWKHADELLPFLFLDLPSKLFEHSDNVTRALSVWADKASCYEYVAQVRMRLLGDTRGLPQPEPKQYAPDGIFTPQEDEVFVDAGAFDGDTIKSFLAHYGDRFRGIWALEPDPASLSKLQTFTETLTPALRDRITASAVALGEKAGNMRFRTSGTMGSALARDGDLEVPCTTLDELLGDRCASYVKMDIEGEELRALRGGIGSIRRCRPVLAVCVYHTQGHLWDIPLFLSRELADYSFFLKPHKPDGWDLVLYAVPHERLVVRN